MSDNFSISLLRFRDHYYLYYASQYYGKYREACVTQNSLVGRPEHKHPKVPISSGEYQTSVLRENFALQRGRGDEWDIFFVFLCLTRKVISKNF